jgi:hypothetical protein
LFVFIQNTIVYYLGAPDDGLTAFREIGGSSGGRELGRGGGVFLVLAGGIVGTRGGIFLAIVAGAVTTGWVNDCSIEGRMDFLARVDGSDGYPSTIDCEGFTLSSEVLGDVSIFGRVVISNSLDF